VLLGVFEGGAALKPGVPGGNGRERAAGSGSGDYHLYRADTEESAKGRLHLGHREEARQQQKYGQRNSDPPHTRAQ
jgi:hypothetical protein